MLIRGIFSTQDIDSQGERVILCQDAVLKGIVHMNFDQSEPIGKIVDISHDDKGRSCATVDIFNPDAISRIRLKEGFSLALGGAVRHRENENVYVSKGEVGLIKSDEAVNKNVGTIKVVDGE